MRGTWSPYSTGKLARFFVEPGHLEKQTETFRACLGGISYLTLRVHAIFSDLPLLSLAGNI